MIEYFISLFEAEVFYKIFLSFIFKHMKHVVVLTGAGISAESGLKTFRDSDGLWEGYDIMEVATPEGWRKNPDLVLDFYNMRRKAAMEVQPNAAHVALYELEKKYKVSIITQNVDDLHERAGSTNIIHLHGELSKSRSTIDPRLSYTIEGWQLNKEDRCKKGSQLRPDIVWFGEAVPMMDTASRIAGTADIFMVIGTSLQVYPAAGLLHDVPLNIPIYVIDPNLPKISTKENIVQLSEKAGTGVVTVVQKLLSEAD